MYVPCIVYSSLTANALYIYISTAKLDSNSFTKTKNWSGRNEVTETSGRLHPLWPQNKWLYTPRTTDYRHTRQDRWIQTELAFTLAKNATKLNPFEIIPLQTARKEKNWKTEEVLVWAAVTVEMERIKGSNLWCLWMMMIMIMMIGTATCFDAPTSSSGSIIYIYIYIYIYKTPWRWRGCNIKLPQDNVGAI